MTTHRGLDLGETDPPRTRRLSVDYSVDTVQELIIAQIALLFDRMKFFPVSRADAVQDELAEYFPCLSRLWRKLSQDPITLDVFIIAGAEVSAVATPRVVAWGIDDLSTAPDSSEGNGPTPTSRRHGRRECLCNGPETDGRQAGICG